MAKITRDEIRKATLGLAQDFGSRIVKIQGIEIEIKQLSVADRNMLTSKSLNKDTNQVDYIEYQINSIIFSCYVPNTNEKIYDETDKETLKNCVSGGYVDILFSEISALHDITFDQAKKN